MNISQLMNRIVETCRPGDNLAAVVGRMWDRDIGCLVVVGDDGGVAGGITDRDACMGGYTKGGPLHEHAVSGAGVITDRDACMAGYTQGRPLHEIAVSVAMSKEVYPCAPDDSIIEAEET